MSGFSRFLLIVFSVTLVSMTFLFSPVGSTRTGQNETLGYEQYLKALGSEPAALSAEALPSDRKCPDLPVITQVPVSFTSEAEDWKLQKPLAVLHERAGSSDSGYIGTLPAKKESAVTVPLNIQATQHYAVTLCAAADKNVTNAICVNGNLISQFSLDGSGKFTKITFYGIFLEEGEALLTIDGIDGGLDLDYITVTNDTTEYRPDFVLGKSPCNPHASAETARLYDFLRRQWGKTMLTGQYASDSANPELRLIYQLTGQLPAIRFGTLGTDNDRAQISAAVDWHVYTQGIVGMIWQWNAPGTDSVYAEDTDFRFHSALAGKKPEQLAMLSLEEAEQEVQRGRLSEEALLILKNIDDVAASLQKLAYMDIPVLWRPLHEAGGGWYWWGASGREAYLKLWSLLWHRLTDYHKLNNLIWIWNGQSTAYLVPEDTYDIASVDVYLQQRMQFGSRYEQFISLARITNGRKMLALSECSGLPDPDMMQLDASVWSFFGMWYGDYLMNPDGSFCDDNYSSKDLYNLYNSELALSLNDFLSLYQ